jgi:hypothetical protein
VSGPITGRLVSTFQIAEGPNSRVHSRSESPSYVGHETVKAPEATEASTVCGAVTMMVPELVALA